MKATKKILIQLVFIISLAGIFNYELTGTFLALNIDIEFTDFHAGSEGKETEEKVNIEEYIHSASTCLFQDFELKDKPLHLNLTPFFKVHHNTIWNPPEVS